MRSFIHYSSTIHQPFFITTLFFTNPYLHQPFLNFMNTIASTIASIFLMAPPGGGGSADGGLINLIFFALLIFVFYFFLIRPQSKRQKEIQKKVEEMKKGDKIVTNGGMIGTLHSISEDTVLVEIDSGVKARFQKSAITDVNPGKSSK